MSKATTRIATDVGGTFTDLVSFEVNENGETNIRVAKTDTTPPNFEQGVLEVIDQAGIDPTSIDFVAHGTTVVINAITERKGAKVGLITTKGFRDSLEIARGNRPDFFNLNYEKPEPFVPRYLRQEIGGRINYRGKETQALDLSNLQEIIERFQNEAVDAIAICFLHSYANTEHEQKTAAAIKSLWPEVAVVASHQITREWREYERTNTAVLSAYVQPKTERYLKRLADGLGQRSFNGSLYIMQSNCGVDSLESVSKTPISIVESGPASGFWGAAELGKLIGEPNIIALDIGGTTAKCSLIENSQVQIKTDYWLERSRAHAGYPVMVPVVDLVEIGNGGGSIAWVDEHRKLHVGPQSAGALPGPAAYGKGGTEATTTDANLWLGRINPDYFCGGTVEADMAAVESAIGQLANKLKLSADDTARGIIRIANNNMVNALKLISVNRGFDPREFTLVAFGGGGAMHAISLAQDLGVKKIVIPYGAAVFSAWGMMLSDLRRDYFVTFLSDFNEECTNKLSQLFEETESRASTQFAQENIDPSKINFLRYGKFRYQNQEHTTEVLIPDNLSADDIANITDNFHDAYEREYTYRLDTPVELVGIHLVVTAEVGKLVPQKKPLSDADANTAIKDYREVDFAEQGKHKSAVYHGEQLLPGMHFTGPAVIEDPGTTIVIHPNNDVRIDQYGNTMITLED